MTITTLRLHRPAPLRLFDDARARFAQHLRERATRAALRGLDRHVLRDIGVDADWIDTPEAESRLRDLALRQRACSGL